MGRKINATWYQQYLWIINQQRDGARMHKSTAETLSLITTELGISLQSLSRMVRVGRFLDRLIRVDNPESIGCGYAQLEYLEKIFRIDPELATIKLPDVLANKFTKRELQELYDQLVTIASNESESSIRRTSRRASNTHKNDSSKAIIGAGVEFFGEADGVLIQASKKTQHYTTPNFLITVNNVPKSAIFVRLGASSKSSKTVAYELMELALAHRNFVDKVWFIFPEWSEITANLRELTAYIDDKITYANWIELAIINTETQNLELELEGRKNADIALRCFDGPSMYTAFTGTIVSTGQETRIQNYFNPTAIPNTYTRD